MKIWWGFWPIEIVIWGILHDGCIRSNMVARAWKDTDLTRKHDSICLVNRRIWGNIYPKKNHTGFRRFSFKAMLRYKFGRHQHRIMVIESQNRFRTSTGTCPVVNRQFELKTCGNCRVLQVQNMLGGFLPAKYVWHGWISGEYHGDHGHERPNKKAQHDIWLMPHPQVWKQTPFLVGGWATPLKNMKVNWCQLGWLATQYMGT